MAGSNQTPHTIHRHSINLRSIKSLDRILLSGAANIPPLPIGKSLKRLCAIIAKGVSPPIRLIESARPLNAPEGTLK